jgi:hypothetical protein
LKFRILYDRRRYEEEIRDGREPLLKLEVNVEPKFLWAKLSGDFSLEEAKNSFLALMDAVAENRCHDILVDGREVTGDIRLLERFLYGDFVAKTVRIYVKRGLSFNPRFAYVLEPSMLDPQKIGETVARNRGMTVKACDRLQDALDYLEANAAE